MTLFPGDAEPSSGGVPPAPTGALPPADWYPDPEQPGRLRYWDGEIWTENRVSETGQLTNIGDWLSRTFTVLWERKIPIGILAFLIPIVLWIPTGALAAAGAQDVIVDFGPDDSLIMVADPSWPLLIAAAVVGFLALILTAVCWLASVHQLYFGHRGQEQSVGASLSRGAKRFPTLVAWMLVVTIVIVALAFIIGLLFAIAPVLGVIGILVAIPLWFFGWVKLAFVGVASALSPTSGSVGTNSAGVSKGRFWPILGRLVVVALVGGAIGFAVNMVVNQVVVASLGLTSLQGIEIDADGDQLLIDGEPLDKFVAADFLPGPILGGVIGALMFVAYMVNYLVQASGLVGLYSDLRMPSIAETDPSSQVI